MKTLIKVLLVILFYSCTPKSSNLDKLECKNLVGINNSLYDVILSYQRINPIPAVKKYDLNIPPPAETAFRYIYEVQITKEKEDTLVIISLKPDGVNLNRKDFPHRVYGVYEDSCLKSTYFISDSSLIKNFITTYQKRNLDKYFYDNSSNIDFMYVQYVYKVSNANLVFKTKIKGNKGE